MSAADGAEVHAAPSGEVITRSPVPETPTATKRCAPVGPPQTTARQLLPVADDLEIQLARGDGEPEGVTDLVAVTLGVTLGVTDVVAVTLAVEVVLAVTLGVEVALGVADGVGRDTEPNDITLLPVPLPATATKSCAPAGPPHVTEYHILVDAATINLHEMPSSEVMTR